ncbi:MAG: hypothetical protein JSS30_01215 [Verrucomicrobia bacterium]|nr:hypothetical protein [Verrucomicrobiota bacterium]
MSILHLCNTFFEWELSGQFQTLEEAFDDNPIFLQLQYLPLVYADDNDGILVTKKVGNGNLYSLNENPPFDRLETWGHSRLAKAWADERKIGYEMPNWDVVKMVNSKAYSFSKSPLPGGKLIYPGDKIPPNTVLKTCFGTAGRGHLFSNNPKAKAFCQEQWDLGLPLISEPWVERTFDFSTQWKIEKNGQIIFLGVTVCKTTPSGAHQSNVIGDTKQIEPFIKAQKTKAEEVLKEMADWGYFGEVGFDAMVYGEGMLQPIVEINARKTMGWAALMLQQKQFPNQLVEMAYISTKEPGPLPTRLGDVKFSRQIIIRSG